VQLECDQSVAAAYSNPAQKARVISECWFLNNCYCLACESNHLVQSAPNTRALDFSCYFCGHRYELKTFRRRPSKSLRDGAYAALIERINSNSAPTLCLLERNPFWHIKSLTAIHSSFLTPWVVEKKAPLREHAQRAGWVGCAIRLDRIPHDGEIAVIEGGFCVPKNDVRSKFKRFLPLETLTPETRGWATLTLSVIRSIGKTYFSLSDLYGREGEFAAIYPGNRHIRPKIRQQLQVLRDLGVLSFEGGGSYRMLV